MLFYFECAELEVKAFSDDQLSAGVIWNSAQRPIYVK